ncbi:hypothetical protein OBJ92_12940 [Empedobacter falsenii]
MDTFLDDAYITLTYSKHFYEYGKPWYNINDKIQGNGQTSVLWMFIQSLFFYLNEINPIYLNKVIGIVCSFIVLFNSYKLLFTDNKDKVLLILKIVFIILLSFWFALNVSHGLETLIYTLFIFLFLKLRNQKSNYLIVFILPFIRPEAFIFLLFFIFDTKPFKKEFYIRIGIATLCLSTYLFYINYFYDILTPLPFILKNTRDFSIIKFENFLVIVLLFLPLCFFLSKNPKKTYFYLPLIFYIFYYSFLIDEVMNVFDRYRFPLMMYYLYFLLYEKFTINKSKTIYVFCIVSCISMIKIMTDLNNKKKSYKYSYSVGMKNGPIFIGKYLKEKSKEDGVVYNVINSDAGAIAYYSDSNLYDTWGLNNAYLLLQKKNNNWHNYLYYLKSINPNYIIVISESQDKFIPHLDFENKIYNYFQLNNRNPELIRKFDTNY